MGSARALREDSPGSPADGSVRAVGDARRLGGEPPEQDAQSERRRSVGTITSNVGLFSGIDTASLIQQILQIEARPRQLAENRLFQLQTQQAAYLDINSRLSGLSTAAQAFRTDNIFDTRSAASSDDSVLSAIAGTSATNGSYTFIVDRLVTTRQQLSRGFADRDNSAIGIDQISFDDQRARLDRDTSLSELNDGNGIDRGAILIDGVEIDLSRVATVGDVIESINSASGLSGVTASVQNGSFVLEGATSVTSGPGDDTAASLGLAGKAAVSGAITGDRVFGLNNNTALTSLNDGRGETIDSTVGEHVFDLVFEVTDPDVGGSPVRVEIRLGDVIDLPDNEDEEIEVTQAAASDIGGVVDRINQALTDAGLTDLSASIDQASGRLVVNGSGNETIDITSSDDTTTAEDLGIAGSFTGGAVAGGRILADANTTLLSSINGGSGLAGDGLLNVDTRDGSSLAIDISAAQTLEQVINAINDQGGGSITAGLNKAGNGLSITDNTTGSNNFVIAGSSGNDSAAALGIAGTSTSDSIQGSNLQLAYLGQGTRLSTLNRGEGIGTGSFRITDSSGSVADITIDDEDTTLLDVIEKINRENDSGGINVRARLNDTGDGLLIEETGTPGATAITIEDTEGTAARDLRIAGTATGTGGENFIDGSFETVIEFEPADTLDDVIQKINEASAGVAATIINDGSSASPFRLSLSSTTSGTAGRFVVDSGDFDLGLDLLDRGEDARVFFGSSDAADGILLSSSSNTLDGVVQGVTIDLKNTSDAPVTLTIATDTEGIEESVESFIDAFNGVLDRIDQQTRFVAETGERGALLGDGTTLLLRQQLVNTINGTVDGFSNGFDRLADVGVTIGQGSQLQFDRERFREALSEDPTAVEQLFTERVIDESGSVRTLDDGVTTVRDPDAQTTFSALGLIPQIEEFANSYTSTLGGTLTLRNEALDSQIALQQDRIESFTDRLATREQILQREFIAMEQAIAQLQSQGSSLSQITSIG